MDKMDLLRIVRFGYAVCGIPDTTVLTDDDDKLDPETAQLLHDILMNLEDVKAWLQRVLEIAKILVK
jgi:hypothetical protein